MSTNRDVAISRARKVKTQLLAASSFSGMHGTGRMGGRFPVGTGTRLRRWRPVRLGRGGPGPDRRGRARPPCETVHDFAGLRSGAGRAFLRGFRVGDHRGPSGTDEHEHWIEAGLAGLRLDEPACGMHLLGEEYVDDPRLAPGGDGRMFPAWTSALDLRTRRGRGMYGLFILATTELEGVVRGGVLPSVFTDPVETKRQMLWVAGPATLEGKMWMLAANGGRTPPKDPSPAAGCSPRPTGASGTAPAAGTRGPSTRPRRPGCGRCARPAGLTLPARGLLGATNPIALR